MNHVFATDCRGYSEKGRGSEEEEEEEEKEENKEAISNFLTSRDSRGRLTQDLRFASNNYIICVI
jgi:hypothetical protein